LQPVAKRAGLASIAELVTKLRAGDLRLREDVIEAMTTNETSFFRDSHPFQALRKDVLPAIIQARKAVKSLDIWCAACSSGQEPYTIAMTLKEHFPELATWKVRILCTDISNEMIEKARNGIYSQIEVNRGLPAPLMIKYFKQDGSNWIIDQKLRSMLTFKNVNLAQSFPAIGQVDLIFVRNVLIYFSPDTKKDILERMAKVLRPEGFLALGSTETTLNITEAYERIAFGRAAFYKVRK
jgi:chemotaxis protein methyltransferase CheR